MPSSVGSSCEPINQYISDRLLPEISKLIVVCKFPSASMEPRKEQILQDFHAMVFSTPELDLDDGNWSHCSGVGRFVELRNTTVEICKELIMELLKIQDSRLATSMLFLPSEIFGFLSLHRPSGSPSPDFLSDLPLLDCVASAMRTMLLHFARQPTLSPGETMPWAGLLKGGWALMQQVCDLTGAETTDMSREMCNLVQMLLSLMSFQIPLLAFKNGSNSYQVYLATVDFCTHIFKTDPLPETHRQIAPFLNLLLKKMICHDMVFCMPDNQCVLELRCRARDAAEINLSPLLRECLDTVSPVSEDQIQKRVEWRLKRTISAMYVARGKWYFPL